MFFFNFLQISEFFNFRRISKFDENFITNLWSFKKFYENLLIFQDFKTFKPFKNDQNIEDSENFIKKV